jgi:hypothetical protein
MKKTLLFLSMFAWLWVGMACSGNDDDNPRMAPLPQYQFRGDYVTDTWNNLALYIIVPIAPRASITT